jgi:RNA polymerase sigma factor (sigma-70 family)
MDRLADIFKAAARGCIDVDAVMELIGQELHHYARVLAGSPETGEDALQDTLVALLQEGSKASAIRNPRAWLFTVLRRKAIAYRKAPPQSLAQEFSSSVEGDYTARVMLAESLERLPAADQEIILLHLWEGQSFEAISEILAMPRNTVLSRYYRAIQQLRAFFGVATPPLKKRQEVRCHE